MLESLDRPLRMSPMSSWWFQAIPFELLTGNRALALQLMREAIAFSASTRTSLRQRLALDVRMAPFRDDPEIKALLQEP